MRNYLLLFWLIIYIAFPTHNSTLDAWLYAADIKHGHSLFSPHHLLYNAMGFCCYKALVICGLKVSTLAMMKVLNAIFAVGILGLWAKIWEKLGKNDAEITAYLWVVGATFGLWRFATENENYIVPIFFSSLGSWLITAVLQKNAPFTIKNIVLSSFWAAFACLFHQLHIWWWVGIGLGLLYKGIKENIAISNLLVKSLAFILPAFVVPITYMLVVYFETQQIGIQPLMQFVFHDFYTGNVTTTFGYKHLLMTVINFIRSFIQLHGSILGLFQLSSLWIIPLLISISLFIKVLRNKVFLQTIIANHYLGITHLIIAVLHFLFAVYSVGNAEFMVMLPLLLFSLLCFRYELAIKSLYLLGGCFAVWNFFYGIFPVYCFDFQQDKKWDMVMAHQKQDLFILHNRPTVENRIYYETGQSRTYQLVNSPTILHFKGQDFHALQHQIDSAFLAGGRVFTNALDYQPLWSRETIMMENQDKKFFAQYAQKVILDSVIGFGGKMYLTEVRK